MDRPGRAVPGKMEARPAPGRSLNVGSPVGLMPVAFRIIVVCFGAAFFLAHFAWAIYSFRFFTSRGDRLAAVGKVVPGFAGVLMIAAVFLPPLGGLICAVLAIPLIIVGRAVFELIIFRTRGGGPAAH